MKKLAIILLSIMLPTFVYSQNIPQVATDKDIYNYGETIKVNFSNAPGKDSDWICIVPAGSLETDAGSYQYMTKGVNQGSLVFDTLPPGKYEARAFYDYSKKGYIISAHHSFSIEGAELYEKALARLGRKIDTQNPLESNLPPGNGMVYIVREPCPDSAAQFITGDSTDVKAEIKADGKSIMIMPNDSYFIFSTPAGDINFSAGRLIRRNIQNNNIEEDLWVVHSGESIIKIKPGYAYYLKLQIIPMGHFGTSLENIPHQDGADMIERYKLTLLK